MRKFKTWPGQKILAVSMQDTSAFAIRNSRVHEREGEPPEQEGTHQHSRLNTKEKDSKLKEKKPFRITNVLPKHFVTVHIF